jgi:hypothetical protein
MGTCSDDQSGGLLVAEMLKNIEHCATEKLHKVSSVRDRYEQWWLVLSDHIGIGLSDFDRRQLLAHAKRPVGWDRIIVVNSHDHTKWFEF